MNTPSLVLFVCEHGALRSRLAAAFFNAAAPAGWRAVSAGIQPQDAVSAHAARLAAGTVAEDLLDDSPPVPIGGVPVARLTVSVDCAVTGARQWLLSTSEVGEPMCDELRAKAEALAAELSGAPD